MRFTIRLSAAPGQRLAAGEAESLVLRLRQELLDLGAERVERVTAGPAPPGTRVDVVGTLELVATVVGTAGTVVQLAELVERWRQRQDRSQAVHLDVAEADGPAPRARVTGRDALVVANATYEDSALRALRSPVHDANALARVLGDPALGGFAVDLLTDADERTVRRRVAEFFAGRDSEDLLLLHFSCHGLKDARGRLHLAARDTELGRLSTTAVPASLINDLMAETASARVILVLDCCYSGAFARGSLVRGDRGVHLADEFGGGAGKIVLTATNATEYSFDGDVLSESDASPSVFTGALVRGLATGDADLDGDGEITVDELFDYTRREVARRTPGQVPMKWVFGLTERIVVARGPRRAPAPEPAAAAAAVVAAAASPVASGPTAAQTTATGGRSIAHPGLVAALTLATVVSLIQFAQMAGDLNIRGATGLSGVAFFVLAPVVAAIALVVSLRQRARSWTVGMGATLVVWVGLFVTADLGVNAGPAALVGFYTEGPDQPGTAAYVLDLTVRLLAGSAGVFWYALRGPGWPRPNLPAWGHRPALLLAAAAAATLSLAGAVAVSAGAADGHHAVFDLAGSARLDEAYNAVVGIGNTWWIETNRAAAASTIWSLGWLTLLSTAVAALVSALRRRHLRWAAAITSSLATSVVLGLAATGTHENQAGVRGLALLLAAMTLAAAAGVLAYAWRGPRPDRDA
ncbi:caspase family protein [Phytohabitans sp. ZYX-F-186]|uniref:Caspase family protein n=1 Tax=Phytohabitans maris TaxID=3071409 RepID=A0ABU0ZKM5_9ACTN|nr:caspase family protein [Phytohabitans sp. ZYX-F-186]MDQ7907606.1 caspase family protein [Phytohabitans sp. ZYX-F-186]